MKALLFLFVVCAVCSAKCGVWNPGNTTEIAVCNDIENLQRCLRAQNLFDRLGVYARLDAPVKTFPCDKYVTCAVNFIDRATGTYWCQNMDSYNLCVAIRELMHKSSHYAWIFEPDCDFSVMLSDNIPVINYYTPPPITTTTTESNMTTSVPSSAAQLLSISLLWTFLILVL